MQALRSFELTDYRFIYLFPSYENPARCATSTSFCKKKSEKRNNEKREWQVPVVLQSQLIFIIDHLKIIGRYNRSIIKSIIISCKQTKYFQDKSSQCLVLHGSVGHDRCKLSRTCERFPICDDKTTENDRYVIKIIGIHCESIGKHGIFVHISQFYFFSLQPFKILTCNKV